MLFAAMKFENCDDPLLMRLISERQPGALNQLYDRYNRLVFSVALAILGDRAMAEEVTLDVFVRVWQGASTYRAEKASVSTWLAAITRNHAIDVLRWHRKRLDHKSLYLDDLPFQKDSDLADPQEGTETDQQRARIRQAVAQLPPEQREALMLAFYKGYSHRQIAELLEEPLGTIKTRIRLGMQKLRDLLAEEPQPFDKSEDA